MGSPWPASIAAGEWLILIAALLLIREASECRLYAEQCAEKARLQSDADLRQDLLDMLQRWLSLAHCYEFSERLEFLSPIETKNKESRLVFQGCMTSHHEF
jgi:hypothetical protein